MPPTAQRRDHRLWTWPLMRRLSFAALVEATCFGARAISNVGLGPGYPGKRTDRAGEVWHNAPYHADHGRCDE